MSKRSWSSLLSDCENRRIDDIQNAVSFVPKVSMCEAAHYVTQTSIYDDFFTGKLTSRRITYYQKMGYYGKPAVAMEHQEKQRAKIKRAQKSNAFITF